MADADCARCPDLRARLASTAAGLHALAATVDTEMIEPTRPVRQLLAELATRARNLADLAQGRY